MLNASYLQGYVALIIPYVLQFLNEEVHLLLFHFHLSILLSNAFHFLLSKVTVPLLIE